MRASIPLDNAPTAEAIQAQLQRILASETFVNAPILSRFLRFIIERRAAGSSAGLKEYTLGVEVFGRGAQFDPQVDTIVRVQARRLRDRLHKYYEKEGQADPLRVTIPKGHYHAEIKAVALLPPAELESQRPAWHAARAHSGVPAPRTPIVGREREVTELCAMLTDTRGARLVTLTGTAGSGKSRLATEVGLRLQNHASSRVTYMTLEAVSDTRTLVLALVRALGLHVTDDIPPMEAIRQHLRGVDSLPCLILDNFEHLVHAVSTIGLLLDACSALRMLITSRSVLHLYGEHEYPVAPLGVPDNNSLPLEQLAQVPAVDLFIRRAAAVRPGFALTTSNRDAVSAICRHFDGLPLGIELAAAQCRRLTPLQVLTEFPSRLDLPTSRLADVSARQRSLRAALEWSYVLLAEPERRLFRLACIFSGGFSPNALVAVGNTPVTCRNVVTEGLAHLHDNSLLQLSPGPDELRYVMLETLREYGMELLGTHNECDSACRAHAAYYLSLAEDGAKLRHAARRKWLQRCDVEWDNLDSALNYMVAHDDGHSALRMVCALFPYWQNRGRPAAACGALRKVLARFDPQVDPLRWSQAACYAAAMEMRSGHLKTAMHIGYQALAVARQCQSTSMQIIALNSSAVLDCLGQRYCNAVSTLEGCLSLCETCGLQRETDLLLGSLGFARLALGQCGSAHALFDRARKLLAQLPGWPLGKCLAMELERISVAEDLQRAAGDYHRKSIEYFLQADALADVAAQAPRGRGNMPDTKHVADALPATSVKVFRRRQA